MKLLISSVRESIVGEVLLKSIYGEDMIQTVYLNNYDFTYEEFMKIYEPLNFIDEIFIMSVNIVSSGEEIYKMTRNLGYYEDHTISNDPLMVNPLGDNIKVNIVYNTYYQNKAKWMINSKFLTWNFIIDDIHEDDYVLLMLHSNTIDNLTIDTANILKRVAYFIIDNRTDYNLYRFYHKVSIDENNDNLYKDLIMNNDHIQCVRDNIHYITNTKDIFPSTAIAKSVEILQPMISISQAKINSIDWKYVNILTNTIESLYSELIKVIIDAIQSINVK